MNPITCPLAPDPDSKTRNLRKSTKENKNFFKDTLSRLKKVFKEGPFVPLVSREQFLPLHAFTKLTSKKEKYCTLQEVSDVLGEGTYGRVFCGKVQKTYLDSRGVVKTKTKEYAFKQMKSASYVLEEKKAYDLIHSGLVKKQEELLAKGIQPGEGLAKHYKSIFSIEKVENHEHGKVLKTYNYLVLKKYNEDLKTFLTTHPSLASKEFFSITLSLLKGVKQLNLLHLSLIDCKPANCLMGEQGAVLSDFGNVVELDPSQTVVELKRRLEQFTPWATASYFSAPLGKKLVRALDQAKQEEDEENFYKLIHKINKLCAASRAFSLGVMCYEMLCESFPLKPGSTFFSEADWRQERWMKPEMEPTVKYIQENLHADASYEAESVKKKCFAHGVDERVAEAIVSLLEASLETDAIDEAIAVFTSVQSEMEIPN